MNIVQIDNLLSRRFIQLLLHRIRLIDIAIIQIITITALRTSKLINETYA
jgi:hypothetical protein